MSCPNMCLPKRLYNDCYFFYQPHDCSVDPVDKNHANAIISSASKNYKSLFDFSYANNNIYLF